MNLLFSKNTLKTVLIIPQGLNGIIGNVLISPIYYQKYTKDAISENVSTFTSAFKKFGEKHVCHACTEQPIKIGWHIKQVSRDHVHVMPRMGTPFILKLGSSKLYFNQSLIRGPADGFNKQLSADHFLQLVTLLKQHI